MDLRSNDPFWLLKNGYINNYPGLEKNIRTEIAVMGAGISGALMAWHLCKAGFKVVAVEKRHVGMGSTAASTALLQYEIDTPLVQLCKLVGEKNAVESYKLCIRSISVLERISRAIHSRANFENRKSFQHASFKKDTVDLKEEYGLRKKHGIELQWLTGSEIKRKFGFVAPGGILSKTGAQVDPFRLTHELIASGIKNGLQVYESTDILSIQHLRKGVKLITSDGRSIHCDKLVIACGYESQNYLEKKVEKFKSTFAIISEPLKAENLWYGNCLIWETATPYNYLRTTADHRILIGGKDEEFSSPDLRDKIIPSKVRALENAFSKLFPKIRFKTDYHWAGVFASTRDGLPYIGEVPEHPDTFFSLGFGGNGITYSVIAARIVTDLLRGKTNKHSDLFSFTRSLKPAVKS